MTKNNFNYEQLEKEILYVHNQLRRNPQSFIPKLRESLSHFRDKIYHKPGEDPIQTYEGPEAIEDAIQFLQNQKPVKELIYNENITLACKDHVHDIGVKGLTTHEGSDGKNISDRIEKYCEWDGAAAENLDFGFKNAENIILNLLIDDGVEERNQRYNLFHPDFKYIGIAAGPHREYGICVVIGYAMDVRPLGSEPKNVSDFIQEYIKNTMNRKKILNPFQEDAPDPPDNTVSLKIVKSTKTIGGKLKKITKKIFSLDNGAQHIIEIED
jgi:uncharacterized protein YkwD